MAEDDKNSLIYTPTWIIAVVCAIIVLVSLAAERGLHHLGKCLMKKGQDSLFQALQKIKEELMLLGFISLLLTIFQQFISNICVPAHLTTFMLPCKKEKGDVAGNAHNKHAFHISWSKRHLLAEEIETNNCAHGKAPFLSVEAIHQLHTFIFVLAVVYVIFCATTMILGGIKVRVWKHWEESIRREISKSKSNIDEESNRLQQIHAHHHHHFQRRRGYPTAAGLIISFFKQFYGSVTKSDYIALRHGFIMTHCPSNLGFDFHKYMLRTLEYDFKKVVGISWYLWTFVVLFLLINLKGWHSYFWLSFLPLILLLLVGTKLEYIITCLAKEIVEKGKETKEPQSKPEGEGDKTAWVKPSDKYFWFGKPCIVLYIIHFILFQNSFEIAFFFWVWVTYGSKSCILDRVEFIVPRLIVGVIVQVLCSFSTLPLYTIVTQMGSAFKQGIFQPVIHDSLETWLGDVRSKHGEGEGSGHQLEMHYADAELHEVTITHETAVSLKEILQLSDS